MIAVSVSVSVLLASLAASVVAICPDDTVTCVLNIVQSPLYQSCSATDSSCACPEFQSITNCVAYCPETQSLVTQELSNRGINVAAVEALCSGGSPSSPGATCSTAALEQCVSTASLAAQKCTSLTDYACVCPVYQSVVACADKCPGSKDQLISQLKQAAGNSADADNVIKNCSNSSSSGLSTGAIAGIAVGCAVLVLALAGLAIFLLMRRRKQNAGNAPTPKTAPATGPGVVSADPAFFSYPMQQKQDSPMINPNGYQPQHVPQYQQQPQQNVYQPQLGHEQQTQYYPQTQVAQHQQSQPQHNFAR